MTYYEVIAGSRSYGLELPESDVDRCRVADDWQISTEGRENLIQVTRQEFLDRVFGRRGNAYYLQWLYPAQICSDNEVSRWLLEHRETITRAQSLLVWKTLTAHAQRLEQFAGGLYQRYPKRLAYATLFYHIAARFGEGEPFAQAHRPEEALRRELLGMRLGEVSLEDGLAECAIQKTRAFAVQTDALTANEGYLAQAESELRMLLGLSAITENSPKRAQK